MRLTPYRPNPYQLEFHALKKGVVLELKFQWKERLNSYPSGHTQLAKRSVGLWEQTCFEFFFQSLESDSYYEINLSPDGRWNTYLFTAYRSSPLTEAKDLECTSFEMGEFFLSATFKLPMTLAKGPLKSNACAVISDFKARERFWSLSHSKKGAPDFHDTCEFIYYID